MQTCTVLIDRSRHFFSTHQQKYGNFICVMVMHMAMLMLVLAESIYTGGAGEGGGFLKAHSKSNGNTTFV